MKPEDLILEFFAAALKAVDPSAAVARHSFCLEHDLSIAGRRIPAPGKVVVAGVGKAAAAMATGLDLTCGCAINQGLLITKDEHGAKAPKRFLVREASHPIPDERGVAATRELLKLVGSCGGGDVVIALISGGGSALLEAPRPPLTLDDLAKVTDAMLRAGAPIQDLNAVRTPLSLVKGGGLRRAAPQARFATLLLSDVLGNDPKVIASGPTVQSEVSANRSRQLLDEYGVSKSIPQSVFAVFEKLEICPPDQSPSFRDDLVSVVADNEVAIEGARMNALSKGLTAQVVWKAKTGEAADLGKEWVRECLGADDSIDVLLGGGEATVTVRGNGVGGRNTEFAAAACAELDRLGINEWMIASLATDGQDGTSEFAGAFGDGATWRRAIENGLDPDRALSNNDTAPIFAAAGVGGAVFTGPTGTNVNDLYFAIRRR
jgi:glycerate 2-kinase